MDAAGGMTSLTAWADERPLPGARRAVSIATVLSAMTLAVLDAGMANVALPDLAQAFGVSPSRSILVVTAYQAGLVMTLLPLGALGERFGHRRVFALSVAVFAAAALAAAMAPGLPWLILARLVQGFGGAGIMALGMALLRFTVSRRQLGRAIGWNALTVALASAAAPTVGAVILAMGGWRWLFAIDLPLAALALLGSRTLPTTARGAQPLDAISAVLSALAFALFIAAVEMAGAPRLAGSLLAAAAAALVLLVRREGAKAAPLFPVDLLRDESFRLSVIASLFCFVAQTAGLVGLPFLLQHQLQQTALASGLCITVWPLSVAAAAALSGWLSDRAPDAWLCAAGGAVLAAGLLACGVASDLVTLLPAVALAGLGFGLFQSPNNRNLFLSAPAHRSGAAGGMQGTARVSGQTAGALMMSLLFSQWAMETALPLGFLAAAALALGAGVVSLLRVFANPQST